MSETYVCTQEQPLRKRALRALSAESIRRARIAALKQELEALEKDLASSNTTIQTTVDQFAKAECNKLAQQVMVKLPRELRDMIYRHLSTRDEERIQQEHFRTTLNPITRLYSYDHARWKAEHFPDHFWNAEYVGKAFFQELVENYYRTSTFIFGDDPGVMKRFLDTDEMGLNLLPKELLYNVEVHLNAVSYDRGSFRAYMFGIPKKPERLQEQLDGIFDLKPGAKVCIHFLTDTEEESDREEHFRAGLLTLFSSVQRAKLAGYKMQFVVDKTHVYDLEADLAKEWASIHG